MGYYASGDGYAKIKDEESGKKLKHLLEEKHKEIDDEIEWDIAIDMKDIYYTHSDTHWHEEDTMFFLNLISPYITEGEMCFDGDDSCHWKYTYDTITNTWIEHTGKIIYNLSDVEDNELIEEVVKRGYTRPIKIA